nr:retrovirus-related Pol polyprotein from transposon TNT 1-94 [Tanacetum cinerariifolium]
MALNHDNLSPTIQHQANVPQEDRTVTMSNDLDLLFSPMFDELLNGSSKIVSKSSAVSAADAPNQRQHHTTPLNNHTTPVPTCQVPSLEPTVSSSENINQAKTYAKNDQKFLGTVKFGNDQIAPILGYGDLVQVAVTIKMVYYVEGLNHNLFSVGQFCDPDLEVAFRKSTCFIHDLKGNDLLTGSCGTDLYSITLQDSNSPNPICLMAKATSSQAWLWHRHLSYLNFDTINLLSKNDIVVGLLKLKFIKDHLCSSCELGKAKRKSFYSKLTPNSKRLLHLLHMDLCGPMRVASINGKRYVLVIVDDYSRYTWTHFLRSKDETPEVLIDFLRLVQRGLQAQVRVVRTDKGTEFLNQTLHAYFAAEGIQHQTSVARTPKQNGVVKRRNRTLVEAARTMLSAAKVPLFFWAERWGNLDKMKEKGDECIFVGYSNQSRAYRVFNKRTRVIMESIHVNFDELPHMASNQLSSDPVPECQSMALEQISSDPAPECQSMASDQYSFDPAPECQSMAFEHDSLSPGRICQENVSHGDKTGTTSNELDLLFSPMFDELLNGSSKVVSKSSAVFAADESTQHHPLEQVIGNPSQYIRTRRKLESNAEMCMFALTTLHAYFAAEGIHH